jgi:UDP-N-acetylglucosamine 1-carboxyvinyltransferase
MDRILIRGGAPLEGTIPISGAKNAALPLMTASLLTDEILELGNMPRLADVGLLLRILGNHGVDHTIAGKRPGETAETGQTMRLSARTIIDTTAPYELVSRMRASFWVIGPLVARLGEARVSMPGGCAIGTRPVDLLLFALEKLGAEIEVDAGYVIARAPKGLRGGHIDFPKVTVSGTHTALMAATLARGTTVIDNAAREPEVMDLAECLNKMGARITGAGESRIVIEGVARLHGASHDVVPDRIETGTYAMAAAMTGGDVTLTGTRPELLETALDLLRQTGTEVTGVNGGIRVRRKGQPLEAVDVTTEVYPGFPYRPPGPVHGPDDPRQGHLAHPRDHLREPVHARAGAGPPRRPHRSPGRHGGGDGGRDPERRPRDGDGPARLRLPRHRGSRGRRRDDDQSRVPPRSRFRGAGGEAGALRGGRGADQGVRRGGLDPSLMPGGPRSGRLEARTPP